jgi:hypothetical protein
MDVGEGVQVIITIAAMARYSILLVLLSQNNLGYTRMSF